MDGTTDGGVGQWPKQGVGWAADEVRLDEPTCSSRLRWVVVDAALPDGMAVNAVACLGAATGQAVEGLLGLGGPDADGGWHPRLPWAGCTVLAASPEGLLELRVKAAASEGVLVSDMSRSARTNRVYAQYLGELSGTTTTGLDLRALSVLGPRNRIDRLTERLSLLP